VHEPDLEKEANMGLFDKKKKKADFSDVQSGSSSTAPRQHGQAPAGSRYTVQKGDTLSAIAKREYGNPNEWRRIYEANRDQIDDPDLIRPGQQLTIPGKTEQGGYR
jgi:nucleoid-associated protein YgaU